jgi:hypothetical protein
MPNPYTNLDLAFDCIVAAVAGVFVAVLAWLLFSNL